MRQLSKKQKNFLDKKFVANKELNRADQLKVTEMQELEQMNDYETIWQDTDRYLADKFFKERYA